MRKKTTFIRLSSLFLLGLLILSIAPAKAQSSSVSISPSTGSMLAGVAGGYDELGVQRGWSSLWQHEQLSLTFNVSDYPDLTAGGQLSNPAGNMSVYNNRIIVMGGSATDCYWTVSLPKGFRMTGYELVLLNDLDGKTINGMNIGFDDVSGGNQVSIEKSFYETGSDFDESNALAYADVMPGTSSGTSSDTKEYVISRESTGSDDMGNILYFVIRHNATGFFGVSIKSFRIYFTAESDFVEKVAPMTPQEVSTEGASFMNYEFTTQKVDVGELSPRYFESTNSTYLVYDYSAVNDLKSDIVLYEDDAVVNNGPVGENGLKGITATRNGDEYYYALKNNVYYVEAPTNATTHNGKNVNMAYRITGAKIKYNFGQQEAEHQYGYQEPYEVTVTEGPYDQCVIYASVRSGYWSSTNYYLTAQGTGQVGGGVPVIFDNEGNIRISAYNGIYYLTNTRTVNGNSRYAEFTDDKTKAIKFEKYSTNNGNRIRYSVDGTYYYLTYTNNGFRFATQSNNNTYAYIANASSQSTVTFSYTETRYREESVTVPAFTPSEYTIKVFNTMDATEPGTDGTYDDDAYLADKEVEVSADNPSGEIPLEGLNNDAIKFEITGLPEGGKALITVELTLQPLNPYINRLDIVCHDPNLDLQENLRQIMTQTFISEDFAVRGGKFVFYVPVGFDNKIDENGNIIQTEQKCSFTFENLNHAYKDNTYYDGSGTGHARYYLVRSEYEQLNPSAYDNGYDADYQTKISAIISGTKKFKFSNAEDLDHSNSTASNVDYEEYPFSVASYMAQGGEFTALSLKNGENDIRYLFTADETRYNIAPTHTTEHRSYAFYTMDIQLITQTYTPAHEWVKVYDSSFYDENGEEVTKPLYGLRLLTQKINDEYGYLTSDQIGRILNNNDAATYYSGEYTPNNNRPEDITSTKQVLYIDASELQAVVYKTVTAEGEDPDLVQIRKMMGENALFYLPKGETFDSDNFAYKTTTGFRTGENIILKDKCPFYAPYDITVDASKYATYSRTIPLPPSGQDKNVTLMLPFTLNVSDGIHTNADGLPGEGLSFSVNTMEDTNNMSLVNGSNVNYGNAYFKPITSSATEANKPYMIKIKNDAIEETADGLLFTVSQKGSSIIKTPAPDAAPTGTNDKPFCTGALIKGEQTSGQFGSDTYQFTNYASYSGNIFDRAVSENVFYFGNTNNKYVDLHTLARSAGQYLYVYPFRGVYTYEGNRFNAKSMRWFNICYDENPTPQSETTAIQSMPDWADLMIRTGKRCISLTATKNQSVDILSVSGVKMERVQMASGDTKVVSLPAGVYVVNGTKIVVK